MKRKLYSDNKKHALLLKHAILCSLTIIVLFSITSLFAAEEGEKSNIAKEERKEAGATRYDDALTKKLTEFCNTVLMPWNQEETAQVQALICNKANPNPSATFFPVLYIACLYNNTPLMQTCINHGSKINA